jgi:hypothetical protein
MARPKKSRAHSSKKKSAVKSRRRRAAVISDSESDIEDAAPPAQDSPAPGASHASPSDGSDQSHHSPSVSQASHCSQSQERDSIGDNSDRSQERTSDRSQERTSRHILDPKYFKEEALPYSSVWIDSNSSWKEIGCERPTHMCGRQGVSVVV